jgi:hypothetical protein
MGWTDPRVATSAQAAADVTPPATARDSGPPRSQGSSPDRRPLLRSARALDDRRPDRAPGSSGLSGTPIRVPGGLRDTPRRFGCPSSQADYCFGREAVASSTWVSHDLPDPRGVVARNGSGRGYVSPCDARLRRAEVRRLKLSAWASAAQVGCSQVRPLRRSPLGAPT